jgi:hypothetical protein
MPPDRRTFLIAAVAVALAAAGCASTGSRALAAQLDPLIGKADEQYMIDRFGDPIERKTVGPGTDVWVFELSDESLYTGNSAQLTTSTRLRVTFRDGVMTAWTSYDTVR